ncbi:MAG TPA: tRNA-dihydrouridine synthase family protein [Spirochaetota bacterium]|nr:tRNA-dihydrouridine synthase family protein [Spirochaetota bacterium]
MKPELILAPIRGVTDKTYRDTFDRYFPGFDSAVAPFIASTRMRSIDKRLLREFEKHAGEGLRTVPQILGNNAEDFIKLANALYDCGCAAVNWNLGCPYPVVVNKKKGSGLLPYPREIESFLEKVIPAMKCRLSIKLRLGLVYDDEIDELIPVFNTFPVDGITIHARTGRQMYDGTVNLDAFGRCLSLSTHDVSFNGDILTHEQFQSLAARFPSVTRWMIGRGALRDPFLPGEIMGIAPARSREEKLALLRKFHNELFDEYSRRLSGPSHVMDHMKELWYYLSHFFPDQKKVHKRITKSRTPERYIEETDRAFGYSA